MAGAGREVTGRAASGRFGSHMALRGSPLPGHFGRTNPTAGFGRTKPTADLLDRTTARAPVALASRAGHSARRCPASLGQHKSLRRKALGRVVPLSRGCGMGTLRQRPPGADGMTRRRWRTILGLARHGRAAAASESWHVVQMDAVRRELRGVVIALLMVAATTVVAYVLIQLSRGAPRLGHLPPAGAAGRLASRPHSGAGRRRSRACCGRAIFFYSPFYSLLRLAAERDPQSRPVHGRGRGHQPSRQFDEAADRACAQARERR